MIHAPCFRERVLHHAVMAHVGPVLDRSLVNDTFACRRGRGVLAAVQRAQQHVRRFPWYAKIDIRSYFASIDHGILKKLLRGKFKDPGLLHLLERIIDSHQDARGRGLPIGALTSQHLANWYLNRLDRKLLEHWRIQGMVRYMDDIVWWCESRKQTREVLNMVRDYLRDELSLEMKSVFQMQRSAHGVRVCGYRVLPGIILLSRRRKRRYAQTRRRWEESFARGEIDSLQLQAGYSSALAITLHADAVAWRREQHRRCPPDPACDSA
jgi:hypothetical protein